VKDIRQQGLAGGKKASKAINVSSEVNLASEKTDRTRDFRFAYILNIQPDSTHPIHAFFCVL
jgi:hypothetical protein